MNTSRHDDFERIEGWTYQPETISRWACFTYRGAEFEVTLVDRDGTYRMSGHRSWGDYEFYSLDFDEFQTRVVLMLSDKELYEYIRSIPLHCD